MAGKKVIKNEPRRAPASGPPAPFTPLPDALQPFVTHLNKAHVYIVHIDRFASSFKRSGFAVPVLLNLSIAALLAWRIYAITPTYLALLNTLLGYDSPTTVDTASKTTRQLAWLVLSRTAMFGIDFVLLRFILAWPITFFLEAPANPCLWRWKVGFRDEEIIVRESRKWGTEDLMRGTRVGGESPFFTTRILPAVDRHYIKRKTGYLMMDKDWDLDFYAMIKAHELVDKKEVVLALFEKTVLAYGGDTMGWVTWESWAEDQVDEGEETRKKIVTLKDRLTAMGKENLFFRWIEIVQYESAQEGGFTAERQRRAVRDIRKTFEEQGIDFDVLVEEIGGLEGTPGMEGSVP